MAPINTELLFTVLDTNEEGLPPNGNNTVAPDLRVAPQIAKD
jgi:hypothetical protein